MKKFGLIKMLRFSLRIALRVTQSGLFPDKKALLSMTALLLSVGCYTLGPPYPAIPSDGPIPSTGRYTFTPSVLFYPRGMVGELISWRDTLRPDRVYFSMKIAGKKNNGSYRVKSYDGMVYRLGDHLEFRTNRCFEFGKKNSSDRLEVLDAWDCDHLNFHYTSNDKFKEGTPLYPVSDERTAGSDWFGPSPLLPAPSPRGRKMRWKGAEFAGIVLEEKPNGEVVLFGTEGARILTDNQVLSVETTGGEPVGKLKVLYRPGDFIHCEWLERPPEEMEITGLVAFATRGKKKVEFF